MKTFCVQTLGCKVNQYESEQVVSLLRARGWVETPAESAALRIINTCSVTMQATSQSRQTARRATRLPVYQYGTSDSPSRPRVLVIGCWATSDKAQAASIQGVDAVLTHQDDLSSQIDRLLELWTEPLARDNSLACAAGPPRPINVEGWIQKVGTAADERTTTSKAELAEKVNENCTPDRETSGLGDREIQDRMSGVSLSSGPIFTMSSPKGATSLPLLGEHQSGRQRAFLKIQDGCDAHCTYCIIPQLRPVLWSKPVHQVIEEARRLVDGGHIEIVLTGIFLGAYGQETALHRRQPPNQIPPLATLIEALCESVSGLKRLRLSSLEPGDVSDLLLEALASHEQVMPHFHLPLQSGSDAILRKMNRQYGRDDFLRMVDRVRKRFDDPALTTDVIVGFPGESDEQFAQTVEIVEQARFIHIHAFQYSPRPGTAAARWQEQFVHNQTAKERITILIERAEHHSFEFRRQMIDRTVQVITEQGQQTEGHLSYNHGRCEKYFSVQFCGAQIRPGQLVPVKVRRVTRLHTYGEVAA